MNTSLTGADVKEDILNFPLLVRLTSGNFDFLQAGAKGEDIRFTNYNGNSLFYEIEEWNVSSQRAAIWVKVDTILGNDSTQSITMHWGNSSADNYSESFHVFDTADGFQGVWHLSETTDDTFYDATLNLYHGVSSDSTRPSNTNGGSGGCKSFDGINDFITMPNTAAGNLNFAQYGQFSVSVWVQADTLIDLQQTLVSKDKFQYFLWIDSTTWQFWKCQDRTGWIASEQPAQSNQWGFLTGVSDGTTQQLYVNGVPTSTHSLKVDKSARDTTSDLILGRAHKPAPLIVENAGICLFKGSLDEVRISSTVLSAAWVRLCYMNQRSDDRLVIFK
jgi:biopolymer transport protein ExbB